MGRHTPGPWVAVNCDLWNGVMGDGYYPPYVAQMLNYNAADKTYNMGVLVTELPRRKQNPVCNHPEKPTGEMLTDMANACLIAAAPRMRVALEHIHMHVADVCDCGRSIREIAEEGLR